MRIRFTPWTARSPDSTASTIAALEDEFEDSLLIDQIEAADMNTGIYPYFNVMDSTYGATGDGATDDTSAIQACIDACEAAGGGTVYFPPGSYKVTAALTVTEGIVLLGAGIGADTTAIGATDALTEIFTATGLATTDTLVKFESTTSGQVLVGCGVKRIQFRTPVRVQYVLQLVGVQRSRFEDLKFDQGGGAGMLATIIGQPAGGDSNTGFSHNVFDNIMVESTGANNVSLHLDGEAVSGGACFQNTFRRLFLNYGSGGSDNAHGIWLEGSCDNNRFHDVQTTRASGSTGYGVYATAGATSQPRHNEFWGFNGYVYEETECLGNIYHWSTSENSGYTQEASHPTHYTVVDNTDRRMYETQRYLMSDELWVGAEQFLPLGASTHEEFAECPAVDIDDNAGEGATVLISPPPTWQDGTLATIRLYLGADTGSATYSLTPDITTAAENGGTGVDPTTGEYTTQIDIASPATVVNTVFTQDVAIALDFTEGDLIKLRFVRATGDTPTDSILLLGVRIFFTADGPNTPGDFDVPARST